jgi:hypothetical protein
LAAKLLHRANVNKGLAGLAMIAFLPTALYAADMSVATFLVKANNLKSMGPLAVISPDYDIMKREVLSASRAYSAMLKTDKVAGRKPHSCPPAQLEKSVSPEMILKHMESVPKKKRKKTTAREALFDFMKKKYPCR